VRLAGKLYVTEAALGAMVAAATVPARPPCPDDASQPGSISAEAATTEDQHGLLETERRKRAQAQALMSVQKLRQPCKNISPETIDPRVVPISRGNS
jgi:hypothetical protein